jgi:hypothetical protein
MTPSVTTRLENLGRRVHELLKSLPDHDATTDTLDYVVGVLYGLVRAGDLEFIDRPSRFDPSPRWTPKTGQLWTPENRPVR